MSECIEDMECTCPDCVNDCHWCGRPWDDPDHQCKADVVQMLMDQTAFVPKAIQIEMLTKAIERVKKEVLHG
jgi:hypothetical protein